MSNESLDNVVMFDELTINHIQGKLLEENHYYPYGMCLRISQNATIQPENKKLYQSKEFCTDENLNIYDFDARQYDPLLGRFTSLDPMGQYASGYVGMGNNPTKNIDPSGMWANATSALGAQYNYGVVAQRNEHIAWMNHLLNIRAKEEYAQEINHHCVVSRLDIDEASFEETIAAANGRHDEIKRKELINEVLSKLPKNAGEGYKDKIKNMPAQDLVRYNQSIDWVNGVEGAEATGLCSNAEYTGGSMKGERNSSGGTTYNGIDYGSGNGVWVPEYSFTPVDFKDDKLGDINKGITALNIGISAQNELFNYAIRTNYKSANTYREFNALRETQQQWREINTLGAEGSTLLKYTKGLGTATAIVSAGISTYDMINYYSNGGNDWRVGAKDGLDIIMTGVGFLGPIGFGVSATYFLLDATTDGFGGFGKH